MKKTISITVDSDVLEEFDEVLEECMVCRSTIINYLMQRELECIRGHELNHGGNGKCQ